MANNLNVKRNTGGVDNGNPQFEHHKTSLANPQGRSNPLFEQAEQDKNACKAICLFFSSEDSTRSPGFGVQ
jgi:hypothetical protein